MSEVDNTAPKRRSSAGNRRRRNNASVASTAPESTVDQVQASTSTQVAEAEAPAAVEDRNAQRRESRKAAKASKPERKGVSRVVDTQRMSGVRGFYNDSMSEIRKVIWPSREQTINLTLLVIAVSVVIGGVLGGLDYALLQLFEAIG